MNTKIAFITGITGQDGSYLAELLIEKHYIVFGLIRRSSNINTNRIEHLFNNSQLKLRYGDMLDQSSIQNILQEITNNYKFDILEIYNLAAMSHVKLSFDMPVYSTDINSLGALRVLESVRQANLVEKARIYHASTSELYGDVLETPQTENTQFNPQSPYAIGKMYSHYLIKNYRTAYNMYACCGILFNHESPRRAYNFVTRKITIGLNKILNNPNYILELGNLDAKRDWGHAKDYVYGMWLMLQQEIPDEYVLATGTQYSVRVFVEKCFKLKNFNIKWVGEGINEKGIDEKTGRVLIQINEKYFRPSEVETLLGDATKAKNELNWIPKISFDELVKEMVENDCK